MAFVALARSRGRASEAAALLHLTIAKEEAALVAMMLDVRSLIDLACETAERRQSSRRIVEIRKFPRQHEDYDPHPRGKPQHRRWMGKLPNNHGRARRHLPPQWEGQPAQGSQPGLSEPGVEDDSEGGTISHVDRRSAEDYGGSNGRASRDEGFGGGSDGRRSNSAPSILPPIVMGLVHESPPLPNTLRTVLATSTSVAVGIPVELGLTHDGSRKLLGERPRSKSRSRSVK